MKKGRKNRRKGKQDGPIQEEENEEEAAKDNSESSIDSLMADSPGKY